MDNKIYYIFSFIIIFIILLWYYKWAKLDLKFFKSLKNISRYHVKDLLSWVISNNEIKKRILITLGLLTLTYIASFIPIPGIEFDSLREYGFRNDLKNKKSVRPYAGRPSM